GVCCDTACTGECTACTAVKKGSGKDGTCGTIAAGTDPDDECPGAVTCNGVGACVCATGVATGLGFACARRADSSLWCWGGNMFGQLGDGTMVDKPSPVQVMALGTSVAAVAAGDLHICARRSDGSLWCWGRNKWGQLGDGTITDESLPVQV